MRTASRWASSSSLALARPARPPSRGARAAGSTVCEPSRVQYTSGAGKPCTAHDRVSGAPSSTSWSPGTSATRGEAGGRAGLAWGERGAGRRSSARVLARVLAEDWRRALPGAEPRAATRKAIYKLETGSSIARVHGRVPMPGRGGIRRRSMLLTFLVCSEQAARAESF